MDLNNERKMFQQLVRASSQANTPQYEDGSRLSLDITFSELFTPPQLFTQLPWQRRCFLLTPKLLPDLEFSAACNVLTIMNGPWISRASESMRACLT